MWTDMSDYRRASLISLHMCLLNVHFTGNKIYHHLFAQQYVNSFACVMSMCLHAYSMCVCVYIGLSALPMFCTLFLVQKTKNSVPKSGWSQAVCEDTDWWWAATVAAPAARDRVSWGCERLQWDVWLDDEQSNNDVVCVRTKAAQCRSVLCMWN